MLMTGSPLIAVAAALAFLALCAAARLPWLPAWRAVLALASSALLITLIGGSAQGLALFALDIGLVMITWRVRHSRGWLAWIGVLIALVVANKLALGDPSNRVAALGSAAWLGFSYIALRLIHLTVEAHAGRLGDATLSEVMVYSLHPASLLAGPIDRALTSVKAQRGAPSAPLSEDIHLGLWRIFRGALLKLAIANPLYAFISVYDMARDPNRPTLVAWLWLIATSAYLLADFAGYTDIAIGAGRLAGLRLPENFARPYSSSSITTFWQRWHMSLSSWLRDTIFFPLSRRLLRRTKNRYRAAIQLVAHLTTMIICGLWHSISPGYVAWGIWHGLGLFVHGRFVAGRQIQSQANPANRLTTWLGVAGTTLFVMLGWVFFTADLPTAWRIFGRLFGIL